MILRRVMIVLEMIKFQHTLFALPFAVIAACYAAEGIPPTDKIVWILVAMVAARSAAMAFNRIADAPLDALNPRTRDRAIPRGKVSTAFAALFTVAMAALFVVCAYMLNRTCLLLSPVALLVILGYSYTKRFTLFSHFVLGLSLAIAPAAAWIGIRESLDLFPTLLSLGVLFWVAGFDIIYACADRQFDVDHRLHSIPARFGLTVSLRLSALCHAAALICFGLLIPLTPLGTFTIIGCAGACLLLLYEHIILKPDDLRRLNEAFFVVNVAVGLILMFSTLLDLFTK